MKNNQQDPGETKITKQSYLNQYLICFAVGLMAVNSGMTMGWIGPTLPKLLSADSPLIITEMESSWLVSLLEIGSIIGTIIATFSIHKIGRKTTLQLAAVPMICCSILYTSASNITQLYYGRLLSGITVGANRSAIFMYISEIASANIRGTLSTIVFIQLNVGLLLQYICGSYVPYRLNASFLIIMPTLFLIIFHFAPESPYYYLSKNNTKLARRSLEILRRTKQVDGELVEIQEFLKVNENNFSFTDLLCTRTNRKSLLIMIGLITLMRLSGIGILMQYIQLIFQQVNTTKTSPELNSIIVVSSVFFSTVFCMYLIDRWGRKPLMFISCSGVAFCLFIIGLYFYLKSVHVQYLNLIAYVPIVVFLGYKMFEGFGIGPISHIILMELFPTNVKPMAVCLTRIYQSLVSFFVIQLYGYIVRNYDLYTIFWLFASFAITLDAYVLLLFPETKKQSLSEIQANFKK